VRVFLDQRSGEILRVDRTVDTSLGASITQTIADVHYGRFLGHVSRAAWVLLGITPLVLFVTGVTLWWIRTGARTR
jgi:uncharacterized iron-regulated membrane protein